MQPPLFYAPPDKRDGDLIVLPADEARHAVRVMRLKRGAVVIVVDGLGHACRAELGVPSGNTVSARVLSEVRDFGEPLVRVTLAAGLSAGTKFDSVVQRGTELGVSRFVPLLTEKSKVAVEDARRERSKLTRWRNVATAAMKQCRRSYIPDIAAPTPYRSFLKQFERSDIGILFHPGERATPLEQVELPKDLKRLTVLVGPESGFSEHEVILAEQAGLAQVGLGRRILRTETAGPVAVALIMAQLGEFR
ncbi:MAG: RsmE family RNA methyltransferase [Candidatus Zixiibacteriota bacterium]